METQLQEYENREFIIFNVSELNQIDFTQVLETSIDTVRKSVDQTKTFVKWDGMMPECVNNLTTKDKLMSYLKEEKDTRTINSRVFRTINAKLTK